MGLCIDCSKIGLNQGLSAELSSFGDMEVKLSDVVEDEGTCDLGVLELGINDEGRCVLNVIQVAFVV